MKFSQLMFHSAERTVAMDVTQAAHMYPSSNSAVQFHFPLYDHRFEALSGVRQQDFRTSPHSDSRSKAMFTGSRHYAPAADPGSPTAIRVIACPESLNAKHPMSWSKDDVGEWLDWSVEEFALDDVQHKKFSMNGKALCTLSKEDFRYRTPNAGDLLHKLLQKLRSRGTHLNQSTADMQMTPSVLINEEMALMRHLVATTPSNFQRHRRTPANYKQGDEATAPAYEPASRFGTMDMCNKDCCSKHYKSSDDGDQPNIPEPLNLKITDNARESYSSSGHSIPHATLDDEPQSSHPMVAIHTVYPPHLPPYPTVHPKTLQEPRCETTSVLEASVHHNTPAGQNARRHIHSPAHCSSPPSGNSPASSGNPNPKRSLPLSYTSSLPHRQSHTGAEFAVAIEDYNPHRKHRREMMEAHRGSSESQNNSSAHPCGDLSYDDSRPVLRDILTSTGSRPSSVFPYRQMVHGRVHVPVIQETAAASTNGNTCTKVITNCTANQRSASISFDSLAHQRDIVPFSPQYPYRLAPSVVQSLTSESSTPSVFPSMFNMNILCDPKVEAATSEMNGDTKQNGAGKKKGHRPLLWQFLWLLLKDKNSLHYICWENEACLVFRIIDTEKVAKLWGKEKNRQNMTYEKMSRGMRYYYNTGILCKEPGQKLTYRFLKTPENLANSKRFSKNKMKNNAACDAASAEARIFQEADTPKSVCSERDPESADEMSTSESASTTLMDSSPRCDTPIVITTVDRVDIKIKEERDGYPD